MSKQIHIGIDLGETYSRLAYINDKGEAEIGMNFEQEVATPNVILFNDVGEKIVGTPAKEMRDMYPAERSFSDIRALIDADSSTEIDGVEYTPASLYAIILSKLIEDFEEAHELPKGSVTEATIAVPTDFDFLQRGVILDAGRIAGLQQVRLLNELTAAAIGFGFGDDENETGNLLVYNLEESSFSASAIKVKGCELNVIAADRTVETSGAKWNEWIKNIIIGKIVDMSGLSIADVRTNDEVMEKLAIDSEILWGKLVESDSARGTSNIDGKKIIYKISRNELETITEHLVQDTTRILNGIKIDSDLMKTDVDYVLLTGRYSRMPMVRDALRRLFPDADILTHCPENAIAMGASKYSMFAAENPQ